MKPILVIGDSHVRAFAYDANFIPLFIGPAAFNNFLTDKSSNRVLSKILALFNGAKNTHLPLLIMLSGDVEHIRRKYDNLTPKVREELEESSERYAACVMSLSKRLDRDVYVGLTLPGADSLYTQFRQIHTDKFLVEVEECDSVKPIDFNEKIADSQGFLLDRYRADFVHISYHAIAPILSILNNKGLLIDQESELRSDFRWWTSVTIGTDYGPFKVWGDTHKDELILENCEKLVLKHAQRRSTTLSQNANTLREVYKTEIENKGMTVANSKQGQLILGTIKHFGQGQVNGFEYVEQNRSAAISLGQLFGLSLDEIVFPDPISLPKLNGVIVDFNWWKTKRDLQDALIKRIKVESENVSVIVILSFDVKSDIRLFKKELNFDTIKLNEPSVDDLRLLSFEKTKKSIINNLKWLTKSRK